MADNYRYGPENVSINAVRRMFRQALEFAAYHEDCHFPVDVVDEMENGTLRAELWGHKFKITIEPIMEGPNPDFVNPESN